MKALVALAVSAVLLGCQPTTAAHRAASSPAATTTSPPAIAAFSSSTAVPATSQTATAVPITLAAPATPPADAVSPSTTTGTAAVAAELAALPIKGRAPMTGYSRAQFGPAWPTENGCDARNEVLRRDLTKPTLQGTCTVETGTLVSPYTGQSISFVRGPNSAIVQIDHVVPLGDAWQKGAQAWTAAKREMFANDPAELLAVDAHSNEQKGDGDAATWLPANKPFRCTYVAIQVSVKATYGLWVTQAEHDAIARVIASCGETTVTGSALIVIATPTLTATVTPTATPKPVPAPTPPVPANGVPLGATALCNDGTYSFAAHHQGACSHHGGVAQFYS